MRFTGHGLYAVAAVMALAAVAAPSCGKPVQRGSGRPNVLLVTLDTTRRDRLGAYGNRSGLTPSLDALAAQGATFEDARTQVPITLPSHATILTGLPVLGHGVRENGSMALDGSATTLAEVLSGQGYETAAFVSSFVLDSRFGLDQGFGTYDDDLGRQERRPRRWQGHDVARWERRADETTGAAVEWIEDHVPARTGKPFFAWVHYFDPHKPWSPPALWSSSTRYPYDAEVAFMDSAVGGLLESLEEAGVAEDTLVVVASDHGESLGEHRILGHGWDLYEPAMRVALLMRLPGAIPAGSRPAGRVCLVDVAATILDPVGAGSVLPGPSLGPAWQGGAAPGQGTALYMETVLPALRKNRSEIVGALDGRWKLVVRLRTGATELYDIESDPGETANAAPAHPAVVQRLKRWLLDQADGWKGGAHAKEITLDPVMEARLRALGYVAVP